ncbi:Octanoyltransferase LIP2, mitochondrial [Linum perenne]
MRLARSLHVWKMGTVNYLESLKLQEKLVSERKAHKISDTLLCVQHPPTYTLGKRRTEHNLLISNSELRNLGAQLHYTERGGDITYHGPGQVVLYPIVSLREIGLGARKYVEKLELTMIELASLYGVKASAGQQGETGVWVGDGKIGAIGVRISSGITSHGLAFNIDPDLNYFNHIVPCGIADKQVTSLRKETGIVLPTEEVVHDQLISCFAGLFGFSDLTWKENGSCSETEVQRKCIPCVLEANHCTTNFCRIPFMFSFSLKIARRFPVALLLVHLLLSSPFSLSREIQILPVPKSLPRRFLVSVTLISSHKSKYSGAVRGSREGLETSLRKAPPSYSNPTQNK